MSRNLLHVTKLEDFKAWLDSRGIEHRPPRGAYQVLQVRVDETQWQCIFHKKDIKEHYTVAAPLERLVKQFIYRNKDETNIANHDTSVSRAIGVTGSSVVISRELPLPSEDF